MSRAYGICAIINGFACHFSFIHLIAQLVVSIVHALVKQMVRFLFNSIEIAFIVDTSSFTFQLTIDSIWLNGLHLQHGTHLNRKLFINIILAKFISRWENPIPHELQCGIIAFHLADFLNLKWTGRIHFVVFHFFCVLQINGVWFVSIKCLVSVCLVV